MNEKSQIQNKYPMMGGYQNQQVPHKYQPQSSYEPNMDGMPPIDYNNGYPPPQYHGRMVPQYHHQHFQQHHYHPYNAPYGSSGSMTSHPGGKRFNEDAYPQPRRFPAREDKYAVMRQNMLKKPPQQIAKSQPYNPATSNTPDKRFSMTQYQSQYPATQGVSATQSKRSEPAEAKSRFLAVNVYGMRAWLQLKQPGCSNAIFELYGMLDERPEDVTGGKKFVIRDNQKRTVNCVFYESDRELPSLMRGRVYRCVGMFRKKQEILHLVSIRESTNEEYQAHKKIAALTVSYLRKIKNNP